LHNTKYTFESAHTHLQTESQAKQIIWCIQSRVIPKDFTKYLLISLTRVSDDKKFIKLVCAECKKRFGIDVKVSPKVKFKLKYHNVQKGVTYECKMLR